MSLFRVGLFRFVIPGLMLLFVSASAFAQGATGQISGTVTFAANGETVHGATVLVVGVNVVVTGEDGEFLLENVPAGTYAILAQREHLTAERETIVVVAGQSVNIDLVLGLSAVHELSLIHI